jgi:hypothetical protein
MKMNILTTAAALSDHDLLRRLRTLAGSEREILVELLAHLAALDSRPSVYAAEGYGSLFTYCTRALRLSEDAACTRIEAARVCRRFPAILDRIASGEMTLTSVRLLGRYLTPENHQAILERASGQTRHEIERLVAELAPQPDTPSTVRRMPTMTPVVGAACSASTAQSAMSVPSEPPVMAPRAPVVAVRRPIVQATAPARYRVQFTIGQATHEKLRRMQALLRREIPDGDPGAIFDRALDLLLAETEKRKLGTTASPRSVRSIRPGTDTGKRRGLDIRTPPPPSRHVPRAVKRVVWRRDDAQCAFVSPAGHRCTERQFLEFHHVRPYARQGPATADNISLRCRRHNQYEAELLFGPRHSFAEARPSP